MRGFGFWVLWLATGSVFAADVPGSQDVPNIERPIGSEIVRYQDGVQSAIRIPLDRVQRVNNRIEISREIQIEGHVIDVTYQLSARQNYDDYLTALQAQLLADGSELLWSCESRACGLSGLWANTLFKVRELYGPNGNQRYAAFSLPGESKRYLSVYAMEQGNRRQYVHLRLVEPDIDQRSFQGAQELLSQGRVVLPIAFAGDRVSPESREFVAEVAENLATLAGSDLAIVAYTAVTPGGSMSDALAQSQRRAEHVQQLLSAAGLRIEAAHGLGGLVAPMGLSPERVEIVKYR